VIVLGLETGPARATVRGFQSVLVLATAPVSAKGRAQGNVLGPATGIPMSAIAETTFARTARVGWTGARNTVRTFAERLEVATMTCSRLAGVPDMRTWHTAGTIGGTRIHTTGGGGRLGRP